MTLLAQAFPIIEPELYCMLLPKSKSHKKRNYQAKKLKTCFFLQNELHACFPCPAYGGYCSLYIASFCIIMEEIIFSPQGCCRIRLLKGLSLLLFLIWVLNVLQVSFSFRLRMDYMATVSWWYLIEEYDTYNFPTSSRCVLSITQYLFILAAGSISGKLIIFSLISGKQYMWRRIASKFRDTLAMT